MSKGLSCGRDEKGSHMGGSHASGGDAETETETEAERSARMRDVRAAQKVAERNALGVMREGAKRLGRIGGEDQTAGANGEGGRKGLLRLMCQVFR